MKALANRVNPDQTVASDLGQQCLPLIRHCLDASIASNMDWFLVNV